MRESVGFARGAVEVTDATLLISSKNYSSWSLRGYLLTRLSGLPFEVKSVAADDPNVRAELLMRASSIRVPCLVHDGVQVWDTLAIAEYLNELKPDAQMLPAERVARARCRSISGEMHSGFSALRASLPMNLRAKQKNFKVWSSAKADIERITEIWRECLAEWGGPWLFGKAPTIADAFYAPVVTRLLTYSVAVDAPSTSFCKQIMSWPDMKLWIADALKEPEQIEELDVDMDF